MIQICLDNINLALLAEMTKAKEAAEAKAAVASRDLERNEVEMIRRPKGEAGDRKRGFNMRTAMQLDGERNKELYEAIQVRRYAIVLFFRFNFISTSAL
jgi:hypothetical protein